MFIQCVTILVTFHILDTLLSLLSALACNVGMELTVCVESISNSKQLPHLVLQSECPQLVIKLLIGSLNFYSTLTHSHYIYIES